MLLQPSKAVRAHVSGVALQHIQGSWSHFRSLSYCPDRHVNALPSPQAALEAVTASQQLVPAIFALAMVTRPLLAVGLPPPEGEGMDLDAAVSDDAAKAEAQVRTALRQLSGTL
jgi:hypothetical protein